MENEIIKQLFERKSVRVYEDRPIEKEKKDLIIQSAMQAPTAQNMCLYSILDITDADIKEKLSKSCADQPFIAKAPTILVFLADYQRWNDSFQRYYGEAARTPSYGDFVLSMCDTLIAAQNAVVAAESMGIGSCYVGDIMEGYEQTKELLKLPKYVAPVALLCFGYPTEQQKQRVKAQRFDPRFIVHENVYHQLSYEELDEMFDVKNKKAGKDKPARATVDSIFKFKWSAPLVEEMTRCAKLWMDQWALSEGKQ